jgi:hypothetical protein
MARTFLLRDAFAHFGGARGRNSRWSWSAITADKKTVVVTIWTDRLGDLKQRPLIYDNYGDNVKAWTKKPGNRERIDYLKLARDHCDGRFRVVFVVARDEHESPRRIRDRYPEPNLVMRLTDLDEQTGEFRAESVSG